ncbi:hypothetical protein A9Q86_12190 [Flavobacteriales bacterium 33_180_T64]|nr:hypothetical protein A9Q86_12190 [Flavobacteriales bacterium 33_180_T64]
MASDSVYAQLPAESEWEITNVTLFQRSNATLKNENGKITLTEHLRRGRKREYTGTLSGALLALTSAYKNTGSTEKDRKCHDYIMDNVTQFPEYSYVMELQADSLNFFFGKLHQPTGIICDDEGVVTKINVQSSEVKLKRIKNAEFRIYTSHKDTVETTTNFSKPFPKVAISSHTIQIANSSENKVSVSFSADVTDVLADIVDKTADINKIYLEYLDPSSETLEVSKPLSIQKSSVNTTKWQPYAHEARVEVNDESIPLIDRETYVNIRAVNVLGNETVASVIIFSKEGSSGQFIYQSYKHNDGAGSGYVNPIQVNLTRSTMTRPSGDDVEIVDITYQGRTLEMVPDPDNPNDFHLQTPLIALDSVPSSLANISNIVAVDATDSELKHKDETRDLYWNYTAHSPSNVYTYAIGLTYKHNIYSREFNKNKLLSVIGVYDEDTGRKLIDKSAIKLNPNEIQDFRQVRGRGMEFKIPYKKELIGKTAVVKCVLLDAKGKKYKDNMGAFKIGALKTIIIGVDGLSYSAANEIISDKKERGFKYAFNKDGKDNGVFKQTLSAIPTITWCNWSGIYSGQPPGKHGITGNSFLKFNSSKTWMHNKLNQLVGAVMTGLGDNAHENAGSLYDGISKAYPNASRKLRVYSAYPWYAKSEDGNVSVSSSGYTKTFLKFWTRSSSTELFGHDPDAARRLDLATSYIFKNKVGHHLLEDDGFDVVSLYFPGPDNIAHYLGKGNYDDPETSAKTDTFYFEPGLSVKYSIRPNTIDVDTPLKSVGEHLKQVTDFYFDKNIRFIKKNGLSYSTMFVLTADHSLHAFHNDSENKFNIFPKDMIDLVRGHLIEFLQNDSNLRSGRDFYTAFKKERSGKQIFTWNTTPISVFINSVVNYSPNGGMGHLYIRTGSSKMDNILLHESTKLLYMAGTKTGIQLRGKNSKLSPKPNKANNGRTDYGAFGKTPAMFVKACKSLTSCEGRLKSNYRWVEKVDGLNGNIKFGTIDEFLKASGHQGKWLDFEARLEELNDKSDASRSGDLVMFTDGAMGYLTLIQGDQFNGWHGGATLSESIIPMFINIPGTVVDESFIKEGFDKASKAILENSPKSNYLRNWHLMQVLNSIYLGIKK